MAASASVSNFSGRHFSRIFSTFLGNMPVDRISTTRIWKIPLREFVFQKRCRLVAYNFTKNEHIHTSFSENCSGNINGRELLAVNIQDPVFVRRLILRSSESIVFVLHWYFLCYYNFSFELEKTIFLPLICFYILKKKLAV